MRKLYAAFLILISLTIVSCKKDKSPAISQVKNTPTNYLEVSFDSTQIAPFFESYPDLKTYQTKVEELYRKRQFHYIWFDKDGINEFAGVLYNKVNTINQEGVEAKIPYQEKFDAIFKDPKKYEKASVETELLNSALFFFYVDKVYDGIAPEKTRDLEWFLPRKKQSYDAYLDSLLINPSLIHKEEKGLLKQYFLLKKALANCRAIETKGGWSKITIDSLVKKYQPGDSAQVIAQIRTRLFISNDLEQDSKSAVYDEELEKGVLQYKKRHGNAWNKTILPEHIKSMNIPVQERIKTIMLNMERCRWVSNDITKSKELVVVNIPAYELTFFRNGQPELKSKVVVGKALNKTVIFSAPMRYIVFRPFWNVPTSILKNEILPAIEKDPNYLAKHNMEWNNGSVRQKPGSSNSLGLVKFLFPNSNAIYLHDTPSKGLFTRESRAFSHGCIRVAKPKQLAEALMKNDPKWNMEKIEQKMAAGDEYWYTLPEKIPVYIGYFTSWVDADGNLSFYEDVYERDPALAALLFK